MEKKTLNTYGGISKSVLERLNKNFQVEPVKDLNRIDEIMSIFIQGEPNTIESILNDSNQILNFKDQTSQTLIHAIIRNETPNISEEKKLFIIRRLIDNKNVSLHTMNNLDQNPLHLACQKGYTLIITYLIENGCDQELIDTYGNTPIHYLVEKFVRDCGENDFYSKTNQDIKLSNSSDSSDLKKINKILKNQSLLIFYELFGLIGESSSIDVGTNGNKIINALKNFISLKVQSSLPEFYELIDDKMKKINEIFGDFNIGQEMKLEKAKIILFTTSDEVFKIYRIDTEFTNIVWNNYLSNQNLIIKKKKAEIKKSILNDFESIKKYFETKIKKVLKEEIINKIYSPLSKFMSGIIFLFYLMNNFANNDKIVFLSNDKKGNLIPIYENESKNKLGNLKFNNNNEKKKYLEILGELNNLTTKQLYNKNLKVFFNGIGNINNLDTINVENSNFIIDDNMNEYIFNYNKSDYDKYINIYEDDATDSSGNSYYVFLIPDEIEYNDKKININNFKNEVKNYEKKEINDRYISFFLNKYNNNFKYSPIRILISIINGIILNIENILDNLLTNNNMDFIKLIQQFYLFDIKYLTELCFKIINNIVILEKYLNNIDIAQIITMDKEIHDICNKILSSSELNNGIKNIVKKYQYVLNQTSISKDFIKNMENIEKYSETFDNLYDTNTNILDTLKNLPKKINEYFSYDQLEKYNEYLSENINLGKKPDDKPIPYTIFNNYSYKIKYPIKYKQYKQEYFKIKEDINLYKKGVEDLSLIINPDNTIKLDKLGEILTNPNYKKNLIEQNFNYVNTCNFNIFYLDTNEDYNYSNLIIDDVDEFKTKVYVKKIRIINKEYPIKNYEISSNEYKFARGYDILSKDDNSNSNIIKDISGNLISGKKEIKTLSNIDLLKIDSDFDSSINSVKENKNKIVSWKIFPDYNISNIDKLSTYIITNNLNELINMLVYMIYKIIEPKNISKIFFQKDELDFINKTTPLDIIKTSIGIDFNNIELDEKSKINVVETLAFISLNDEKRQEYLLDNIKIFVKTILYEEINKQIFKIMDEIKIKKSDNNEMAILSSKTIDTFNKELNEIDIKYKNDFWMYKLPEYIRDLDTSTTLEFLEIINLSGTNTDINKISQKEDKIIGSKCLNIHKTDELFKINKINYKVLDSNGNTILIRLIEQFNIYGIKKILGEKKILSTYKNKNMETPIDYLFNLVKNIQLDYMENNIKQRLDRYSVALDNTIKSSKEFDGIELSDSLNLVSQIILNSIYLFNETLWLKIYSYPSGWSAEDKNNLKILLNFKEEKLLINSFDNNDNSKYLEQIKYTIENKISLYIKTLEKEINELINKSQALKTETEDDIIKNPQTYIDSIDNKIKEKQIMIEKYKEINTNIKKPEISINSIKDSLDKYSTELLDTKNLSIKWFEYKKLVDDLDDKYLKIITILDVKCESISSISNHIIKIFNKSIIDHNSNELIGKYFKLIFTSIFNDYWDLDRYEDSEYNIINNSIIEILKINVVGIIKNELINTLSNYIIQINKNNNESSSIIKSIKNNNDLKQSIKIYLTKSLIMKLGLDNPDKPNQQITIDEQKSIIINILNKILGSQLDNTSKEEINKIIEFNKFVCENIGLNSYDEITKILYDGKKIALYYEIYEELDKALN
jgi:hypothetical protein